MKERIYIASPIIITGNRNYDVPYIRIYSNHDAALKWQQFCEYVYGIPSRVHSYLIGENVVW